MRFKQWLTEGENAPFSIPMKRLYGWAPKVEETVQDIKIGKKSFSQGQPIKVSRLDNPRGCFFVIDGYHRILEAMMSRQPSIVGVVDQHVPRIERTGGSHDNMVQNKIPLLDALPRLIS